MGLLRQHRGGLNSYELDCEIEMKVKKVVAILPLLLLNLLVQAAIFDRDRVFSSLFLGSPEPCPQPK
jgi:hypothetical protein